MEVIVPLVLTYFIYTRIVFVLPTYLKGYYDNEVNQKKWILINILSFFFFEIMFILSIDIDPEELMI